MADDRSVAPARVRVPQRERLRAAGPRAGCDADDAGDAGEEAEHRDPRRGAHIHPPVRDDGRDELVAGAECVAPGRGLVRVVQLVRQVQCVVGMKHGRVGVLNCPDDRVRAARGGNARSGPRVRERPRADRRRCRHHAGVHQRERLQLVAHSRVVQLAVEIRRRGPGAAGQGARHILIEVGVAAGVPFAHRIAVGEVDVPVFSGAGSEMPDVARAVHEVGQYDHAARAQVAVGARLRHGVERGEVIRDPAGRRMWTV